MTGDHGAGQQRATGAPRATLADVALLVGSWRGEFMGSVAEEVWLAPAGGTMVGMFRLFKEDRVVFYEFMILVEEEGRVCMKLKHFHPDFRGWEEKDAMVTFPLVSADGDAVLFDGLTYRRQADGSLRGTVVSRRKDGTMLEESFTLHPVA